MRCDRGVNKLSLVSRRIFVNDLERDVNGGDGSDIGFAKGGEELLIDEDNENELVVWSPPDDVEVRDSSGGEYSPYPSSTFA